MKSINSIQIFFQMSDRTFSFSQDLVSLQTVYIDKNIIHVYKVPMEVGILKRLRSQTVHTWRVKTTP